MVHALLPVAVVYVPLGHARHTPSPSAAYVPAAHTTGATAGSLQSRPAGHTLQRKAPVLLA
jgi:hypothetical protein